MSYISDYENALKYSKKEPVEDSEHNKFAATALAGNHVAAHAYSDWLEENNKPLLAETLRDYLERQRQVGKTTIDYTGFLSPHPTPEMQKYPYIGVNGINAPYPHIMDETWKAPKHVVRVYTPISAGHLDFSGEKPTHMYHDAYLSPKEAHALLKENIEGHRAPQNVAALEYLYPELKETE